MHQMRLLAVNDKPSSGTAMPSLPDNDAAERFVTTADPSEYDPSGFKPMHFEMKPKSAALHMRLPAPLLNAIKAKARARSIPYTRYVRILIEADVARNSQ